MTDSQYGVFVVEDNKDVRARICAAINDDPALKIWGEAGSVCEASKLLAHGLPAIALVDLGLPDDSGACIIGWLQENAPQVETLVLTVFGDENHVVSAIKSGASGYLLKCDAIENIAPNIKLVLQGESPISPAVARHILKSTRNNISDDSNEVQKHDLEKPKLTPTELEVLNYVAKGFTAPEIADITGKSVNTVPVHIKNIYKKLAVRNRGEAVYEAMQWGFIGLDKS